MVTVKRNKIKKNDEDVRKRDEHLENRNLL